MRGVSLSVFLIFCLAIALFVVRSVYFFLINYNVIVIGSIGDYIMVEIPTFFYFQICIQILIAIAFFSHDEPNVMRTWAVILLLWGVVWLGFAGIVIAMSFVGGSGTGNPIMENNIVFLSNFSFFPHPSLGTIVRSCDCRLSTANAPSDAARFIRIGYKSAILAFALLIFLGTLYKATVKGGLPGEMLTQIILITTCLLLNCVAFIIYYGVDTPTPYFAIVLWFTELLPILVLLYLLARPGMRMLMAQTRHRTLHATR